MKYKFGPEEREMKTEREREKEKEEGEWVQLEGLWKLLDGKERVRFSFEKEND